MKSISEVLLHISDIQSKLDLYKTICEEVYAKNPSCKIYEFSHNATNLTVIIDPFLTKESLKDFTILWSPHEKQKLYVREKYEGRPEVNVRLFSLGIKNGLRTKEFLFYLGPELKCLHEFYPERFKDQLTEHLSCFDKILVQDANKEMKNFSFQEFMDYYPKYFDSSLFI